MATKLIRIIFRRGDASTNPVMREAEPGYSNGVTKVGDGVTPWNSLPHLVTSDDVLSGTSLTEHIESETPHPAYDDGPSFALLYENAKV